MAFPSNHKRPRGRPKGTKNQSTLNKETAKAVMTAFVLERLQPLLEAQCAQALGIKYLMIRDAGGKFTRVTAAMARNLKGGEIIEVWEKDPSTQAFDSLINRTIGKPDEAPIPVEVTTDWNKLAALLASARKRVGLE